jgi:hypothetical protein
MQQYMAIQDANAQAAGGNNNPGQQGQMNPQQIHNLQQARLAAQQGAVAAHQAMIQQARSGGGMPINMQNGMGQMNPVVPPREPGSLHSFLHASPTNGLHKLTITHNKVVEEPLNERLPNSLQGFRPPDRNLYVSYTISQDMTSSREIQLKGLLCAVEDRYLRLAATKGVDADER